MSIKELEARSTTIAWKLREENVPNRVELEHELRRIVAALNKVDERFYHH